MRGLRRSQRPTPRSSIRLNGTLNELLAAKEVRRYVYLRSGQLLDVKPVASLPASGGLIVVAANGSTLLESLRDAIGYEPTEGQTLLKSVTADGRNILVVSGGDADATLMAAYRYAEKIGVGFDLVGDAIPDAISRPIALRLRRGGEAAV